MLVLARKKMEMIHIGQDIVIKVLHIRNGVVRIGIDAPASVRVMRGELKVGSSAATAAHVGMSGVIPVVDDAPLPADLHHEITVIEHDCRPAAAAASNPVVTTEAPLASLLRALRAIPAAQDASALQTRAPQRN